MTFTEIYREKKKQPTPASAFINEISLLTKKSKVSVIHWAQGYGTPSEAPDRRPPGRRVAQDNRSCPDYQQD